MPDLSKHGVHLFWCEYDRRILYRIVTSMERVEDWTVDDLGDINRGFELLGQLLEDNPDASIAEDDDLVKLLSHTHIARTLRIMQYMDSVSPGSASKMLMNAEKMKEADAEDPHAALFLSRNMVFERLQLIGRVFAPERINLVINALEKENE